MNLLNPHYVKATTPAEQEVNTYKAQIESWLVNNPDRESVTFDQIRGFFEKTKQEWPDGLIHSRLLKWGYEVGA